MFIFKKEDYLLFPYPQISMQPHLATLTQDTLGADSRLANVDEKDQMIGRVTVPAGETDTENNSGRKGWVGGHVTV